jgi:hypothetical protein
MEKPVRKGGVGREEGRGKREEGRGKREEGRGKREETGKQRKININIEAEKGEKVGVEEEGRMKTNPFGPGRAQKQLDGQERETQRQWADR